MIGTIRAAGVMLLIGVTAAEAQGRPGGGRGMGPPLDDAAFRPTIASLTTLLQLTPDQVMRITPLRDTLLLNTRSARQEARAVRAAMAEARRSGASADSMAALRAKLQGIMLGMMPARTQFHAAVRALLTEEQAKVFDAREQEMMGSMGQRAPGGRNSSQ